MDLEDDPEGASNLCACQLQVGRASEVAATSAQRSVFHCQNIALGHMKLGNFAQARQLLDDAIELAESEELPDEIMTELKVMLASCLEQNNEPQEAKKIYESIQDSDISNPVLQLIIFPNRAATADV